MKFITEAEHVHSSSESYYAEQFEELKMRLGIDSGITRTGCQNRRTLTKRTASELAVALVRPRLLDRGANDACQFGEPRQFGRALGVATCS